ncbi:MAG TPA: DUF5615 family PIN-like protein [Parafilimonas sp.]|jgi:hypothetical protein|nr:DUF5615 family PIN-like protein [Parafilimonas sp.]
MKLLLDENLPKKLKLDFPSHEVFTVREMQWNGIKNGALLKLMIENDFNVLLSFDQNIQYQQNFAKYSITVFVLIAEINTYKVLHPLCLQVNVMLKKKVLEKGVIPIQ